MPDFGVSRAKEEALRKKMGALGVREEDLQERFIRSAGPGGQNVNKVATCVYLKHTPSGTAVKVGRERSQALNRFLARRELVRKIKRSGSANWAKNSNGAKRSGGKRGNDQNELRRRCCRQRNSNLRRNVCEQRPRSANRAYLRCGTVERSSPACSVTGRLNPATT